MTCCETCPLFEAFAVEPGWACMLHLVDEIESKCTKRIYLEGKAAELGQTLEQMLKIKESKQG